MLWAMCLNSNEKRDNWKSSGYQTSTFNEYYPQLNKNQMSFKAKYQSGRLDFNSFEKLYLKMVKLINLW